MNERTNGCMNERIIECMKHGAFMSCSLRVHCVPAAKSPSQRDTASADQKQISVFPLTFFFGAQLLVGNFSCYARASFWGLHNIICGWRQRPRGTGREPSDFMYFVSFWVRLPSFTIRKQPKYISPAIDFIVKVGMFTVVLEMVKRSFARPPARWNARLPFARLSFPHRLLQPCP